MCVININVGRASAIDEQRDQLKWLLFTYIDLICYSNGIMIDHHKDIIDRAYICLLLILRSFPI